MSGELKTVSGFCRAEFTEKRSTFIGYTDSVSTAEEAEAFIAKIKKQDNDARHNVWAYMLADGQMRYSDDGEPQGTGGIPTLEVIKKNGITNTAVVVTRYFGGILLGAPGLVRAYSKAATMAIEAAGIVTYLPYCACRLVCAYGEYEKLLYEIKKYDVTPGDPVFSDTVVLSFSVPESDFSSLSDRITAVTNAKRTLEKTDTHSEPAKK